MAAPTESAWRVWYNNNKERVRPIMNARQNLSRRANREAYNTYERERRKLNPEREVTKRRKGYEKRRKIIHALKNRPCTDCHIQYPSCVMDFDHVRGKKLFDIAHAYNTTIEALLLEVTKCDVVCANCHRIRTHNKE